MMIALLIAACWLVCSAVVSVGVGQFLHHLNGPG
jgi:hypothetical protein